MTRWITAALLLLTTCTLQAQPATQPSVRCAVINGMMHTNFWPQLTERFEKQTGIKVETLAFGEKTEISQAFRKGGIDLITMHASDQIINLVADGWAMDPQPWCRNDLVLIGPPSDPAGIKGTNDVAEALKKIAASKSPLVVHASIGAQGVLRAIVDSAQIEFDPANVTVLFEDRQREVLGIAQQRGAYTLIGRIPFLTGRIPNHDMVLMVRGDSRLTRPYVVAVADPAKVPDARPGLAARLARYLREPQTQAWIAQFAKGQYDDAPLFHPVEIAAPRNPPGVLLSVGGEVLTPLQLTADAFANLPRQKVPVKSDANREVVYEGVLLRDVLKQAGSGFGSQQPHGGRSVQYYVSVEAADGYSAVFSMAELDDAMAERSILVADRCDGKPLDDREGSLRMVVPQEQRRARWIRQV